VDVTIHDTEEKGDHKGEWAYGFDFGMRTLEEVRARISEIKGTGITWRNPAWKVEFPEVPIGTLCRIAKDSSYDPIRNKTRRRLGLPDFVLVERWDGYKVRHERLNKGGKSPKKMNCPHCQGVFPAKGNLMKEPDAQEA